MIISLGFLSNYKYKHRSENFLKKAEIKKKPIFDTNRVLRYSNLELTERKVVDFQRVQLIKNEFNLFNNLEKFNKFMKFSSQELLNISPTKKKFDIAYPLKQNYSILLVPNIEHMGYFNILEGTKIYNGIFFELKLESKLNLPSLIFTNSTVLFRSEKATQLIYDNERTEPNIFLKNSVKKVKKLSTKVQGYYQIFFLEKAISKILRVCFNFFNYFYKNKNEIVLERIEKPSVFCLKLKGTNFDPTYIPQKTGVFEFNKSIRKTFKFKYELSPKIFYETVFLRKNYFQKLKIIVVTNDILCLNPKNTETLKYSKNTTDTLCIFTPFDRISCSILISSDKVSKTSQILENIKFKKLDIKIFQLENVQKLSLQNLVEFISDMKLTNQRIIMVIGNVLDFENLNFIFPILILPKVHCLKIFSALKNFLHKKGKIFFIKKCFEKNFIFYPIISSPNYAYKLSLNSSLKTKEIEIKAQFQKKLPMPLHGIDTTIYIKEYIHDYDLKNIIQVSTHSIYISHNIIKNKYLKLFLYYTVVINYREMLLLENFLIKKKIKNIIFYQIFSSLFFFQQKIDALKFFYKKSFENLYEKNISSLKKNFELK